MTGRIWAFVPVIVIGAAVIPNAIMIATAKSRGPDKVEEHAWEASKSFDEEREASQRFSAAGYRIEAVSGGHTLMLQGGDPAALQGVTVYCYRPDDRSMDAMVEWSEPGKPLDLSALRRGPWYLTLEATLDGAPVRSRIRTQLGG